MATESQINANRANAELSTGPTSPEGKAKSSRNALKHGLTDDTVLLPTDDVAAYEKFVAMIVAKHKPHDDYEKHLVRTIADTEWRLLRVPKLEAATFALGRHELEGQCDFEPDEQVRQLLLDALIARTYSKDLRNLAIQERRLRSQLEKLLKQLREHQAEPDNHIAFYRRDQLMNNNWRDPITQPLPASQFGFEITDEYLNLRKHVSRTFGIGALAKFDHDWRTKLPPKPKALQGEPIRIK